VATVRKSKNIVIKFYQKRGKFCEVAGRSRRDGSNIFMNKKVNYGEFFIVIVEEGCSMILKFLFAG
jgi:hypothetical protein